MIIDTNTILVTGGMGFIGSNFIRYVLSNYTHTKIINLDKLTYAANKDNLTEYENNPNYTFVKGCITDKKLVDKIVKKADVIFNFAAESHVDRSITNPQEFIDTNIIGTYILLEAAKKHKIEKFIQISTDEVYGSIKRGSFKETDVLNPSSAYSASKAAAEMLCLAYHKTHGVPVIITRSSNNYGPRQNTEKLIPLFITNLIQGKKVPVYGTGKNVRDWIFVKDNCDAIFFIYEKGVVGEVYNIGGGNEKRNIDITKTILSIMMEDDSMIEYVDDRLGHDWRYAINSKKLKKLGWKPKTRFNDGIHLTILWYLFNNGWVPT